MPLVTPKEKENVLANLREMDPTDFETFVARLWEAKGWETEVTRASGDGAVDFYARRREPEPESVLVQVKRHGENSYIGEPEMRELGFVDTSTPDADRMAVVTTNRLSKDAKILALEQNIEFTEGDDLAEQAIKHRDKMNDPETGQRDRVSAAVRRRPATPSLPSPIEGYNWLISPAERDRWRNVVSLCLLLIIVSFVVFIATQTNPGLRWLFTLSGWGLGIGHLGSTYAVFKDLRYGMNKSMIVRIYATFAIAVLPFFAPLVYLKIRDPAE